MHSVFMTLPAYAELICRREHLAAVFAFLQIVLAVSDEKLVDPATQLQLFVHAVFLSSDTSQHLMSYIKLLVASLALLQLIRTAQRLRELLLIDDRTAAQIPVVDQILIVRVYRTRDKAIYQMPIQLLRLRSQIFQQPYGLGHVRPCKAVHLREMVPLVEELLQTVLSIKRLLRKRQRQPLFLPDLRAQSRLYQLRVVHGEHLAHVIYTVSARTPGYLLDLCGIQVSCLRPVEFPRLAEYDPPDRQRHAHPDSIRRYHYARLARGKSAYLLAS